MNIRGIMKKQKFNVFFVNVYRVFEWPFVNTARQKKPPKLICPSTTARLPVEIRGVGGVAAVIRMAKQF